jgi:hypothetical protein
LVRIMGIENNTGSQKLLVSMESETQWKGVLGHGYFREFIHQQYQIRGINVGFGHVAAANLSHQTRQGTQSRPDESGSSAQTSGYADLYFWSRRRISGGLVSPPLSSLGSAKPVRQKHSFSGFSFDGGNSRSVSGHSSRPAISLRNPSRTTRWVSILRSARNDVRVGCARHEPHSSFYLPAAKDPAGKSIHPGSTDHQYGFGAIRCFAGSGQQTEFFRPCRPIRQSARYAASPWFQNGERL